MQIQLGLGSVDVKTVLCQLWSSGPCVLLFALTLPQGKKAGTTHDWGCCVRGAQCFAMPIQ